MRMISFASLFLALVAVAPASAQVGNSPPGQGVGAGAQGQAYFSVEAQVIIRSYFQKNPLTPDALPPGIRKQLAKGKPLPPGIAKKALPAPLTKRLPPVSGYQSFLVGPDVLLVEVASGVVVDIMKGVLK